MMPVAVLVAKLLLGSLYTAEMVCVDTVLYTDDGAVKIATSGLPRFSKPVPIDVPPSLKVTVPTGATFVLLVSLTVAVNVTLWPNTDGLAAFVTVVVVLACVTVCKSAILCVSAASNASPA